MFDPDQFLTGGTVVPAFNPDDYLSGTPQALEKQRRQSADSLVIGGVAGVNDRIGANERPEYDAALAAAPDPDEVKARVITKNWVQANYPSLAPEIESAWPSVKRQLTKKLTGRDEADVPDGAFNGVLTEYIKAREEATVAGTEMLAKVQEEAFNETGEGWLAAYKKSAAKLEGIVGMTPEMRDSYRNAARQVHEHAVEKTKELKYLAESLIVGMGAEAGVNGRDGKSMGFSDKEFMDMLLPLSDEDRQLVYHMVATRAKKSDATQGNLDRMQEQKSGQSAVANVATQIEAGMKKVSKKFSRDVAGLFTDQGDAFDQDKLVALGQSVKSADILKVQGERKEGESMLDFIQRTGPGEKGIIDFAKQVITQTPDKPYRNLTDDEKADLNKESDTVAKQYRIGLEMKDLRDGVIDPAQFESRFIEGVTSAPGQIAYSAQMAIPYAGLALFINGNRAQRTRELLGRGVPINEAHDIAIMSSVLEAPVEWVQNEMLFGRIPGLKSIFTEPLKEGGLSALLKRGGKVFTMETIMQNGQELVQDGTNMVLQDVLARFDPAVPEVTKSDWSQFWHGRIDTAYTMLPITLIGTGVGSMKDGAFARQYLSNKTILKAAGFTEQMADRISEKAAIGDVEQAQAMVEHGWQDPEQRPQASVEQENAAAAADVASMAKFNTQSQQDAFDELDGEMKASWQEQQNPDGARAIKNEEGTFTVVDSKGTYVDLANNAEEAVGLVRNVNEADSKNLTGVVDDMIDYFKQRGRGGEIEKSEDIKTLGDRVEEGQMTEDKAKQLVSLYTELGILPQGTTPSEARIYGESAKQYNSKTKVFEYISRLYHGADPLVLVEEESESYFKQALDNNLFSLDEVESWRSQVEGKPVAKKEGDMRHRENVEWFSKYAQAYITGKAQEMSQTPIPLTFKRWLDKMREVFAGIFQLAKDLIEKEKAGQLPEAFQKHLARAVGLDDSFVEQRMREEERTAAQQGTADQYTSKEALHAIKLPTPKREKMGMRGELSNLWESMKFNERMKLFAAHDKSLDKVAEQLREDYGFSWVKGPDDVIKMAEDTFLRGKEYRSDMSAMQEATMAVRKPKDQTADIFDSGLAGEEFTLFGGTAEDHAGVVDREEARREAKKQADAAQGEMTFSIAPNGAYKPGGLWYHGTDADLKEGRLQRFAGGTGSDMGGIFLTDDSEEGKRYASGYGRKLLKTKVNLAEDEVFNLSNPEHVERVREVRLEDAVGEDMLRSAFESQRDGSLDWATVEPDVLQAAGFKGAILMERPAGMFGAAPVRSLAVFDGNDIDIPEEVDQAEANRYRSEAYHLHKKFMESSFSLRKEDRDVIAPLTDRAEYDRLQAEMKALGYDKVGSPEFNALWQQSEDIKNRNGGMPPGETAGGTMSLRGPVFYSRLTKTVEDSKQGKASGAQWKAMIKNSKLGVNQDEFALVGIGDLEDGKTYTKQEVLDYLKANEVKVEDVTLGGVNTAKLDGMTRGELAEWYADHVGYNPITDDPTISTEDIRQTIRDYLKEVPSAENDLTQGDTHFDTYVLPGAVEGSYREILLTVPEQTPLETLPQGWRVESKMEGQVWNVFDDKGKYKTSAGNRAQAEMQAAAIYRGGEYKDTLGWRDGHSQYSEHANPIVRLRYNVRTTPDGKRMLFLEEVQAPQKAEFEKMPALFQKNWREIAFKWAIRKAADEGLDLGWTTGDQQAEQFRSLSAIRDAADGIQKKEAIEKLKEETNDEFMALVDDLTPYYRYDAKQFGYLDQASQSFKELGQYNGAAKWAENFKDVPPDLMQRVRAFMVKLANAPTEYFEAKIQRGVLLSELAGAVIPSNASDETRAILKKYGLRTVEYPRSDEEARAKALESFTEESFAIGRSTRAEDVEAAMKPRMIGIRVKASEVFANEMKRQVGDLKYQVRGMSVNEREAKAVIEKHDGNLAKLTAILNDPVQSMHPATKVALAFFMAEAANKAGDYATAAEVAKQAAMDATSAGQSVNELKRWSVFTQPETCQQLLQTEIEKENIRRKTKEPAIQAVIDTYAEVQREARKLLRQWLDEINGIAGKTEAELEPVDVSSLPEVTFALRQEVRDTGIVQVVARMLKHSGAAATERALIERYGKGVESHIPDIFIEAQRSLTKREAKGGKKFKTRIPVLSDDQIERTLAANRGKTGEQVEIPTVESLKQQGMPDDQIEETLRQFRNRQESQADLIPGEQSTSRMSEADIQAAMDEQQGAEGGAQSMADMPELYDRMLEHMLERIKAKAEAENFVVPQGIKDQIAEVLNRNGLQANADDVKRIIGARQLVPNMTPAQAEELAGYAKRIASTPLDSFERGQQTMELFSYVHDQLTPHDIVDVAFGLWYANVLSGLVTSFRNIAGNSSLLFLDQATETIFRNPMTYFPYLQQLMKATSVGLEGAAPQGSNTLRTGQEGLHRSRSLDDERRQGVLESKTAPAKTLRSISRMATRFLTIQDLFFANTAYEMKARQLAWDQAVRESKTGKLSADKIEDRVNRLLNQATDQIQTFEDRANTEWRILDDQIKADYSEANWKKRRVTELQQFERDRQLVSRSLSFAQKVTLDFEPEGLMGLLMTNLSQVFTKAEKATDEIRSKPVRLMTKAAARYGRTRVIPFMRVPVNVFNRALDYGPVGYGRSLMDAAGIPVLQGSKTKVRTAEERSDLMKRATLGTLAMLPLAILCRPPDPDDEPEENSWLQIHGAGSGNPKANIAINGPKYRAYSLEIRAGGKQFFVDYRFFPLAPYLAAIGSLHDRTRYKKTLDDKTALVQGWIIAQALKESFMSSSPITSLRELSEAAAENQPMSERAVNRTLARGSVGMVANLIPLSGLWRSLDQLAGGNRNTRDTLLAASMAELPVAGRLSLPSVDALGDDMKIRAGVGWLADWSKMETPESRIYQAFAEKDVTPTDISRYQNKMTPEMYYDFAKARGTFLKDAMMTRQANGQTGLEIMLSLSDKARTKDDDSPAKKFLSRVSLGATRRALMKVGYTEQPAVAVP